MPSSPAGGARELRVGSNGRGARGKGVALCFLGKAGTAVGEVISAVPTVAGVVSRKPFVGDGGTASARLVLAGEDGKTCLLDLGMNPAISEPASNSKSTQIHTENCFIRTEGKVNDLSSDGSDTDDILLLKKKYKSLKTKHAKCNLFAANAEVYEEERTTTLNHACSHVLGAADHGGVSSKFKNLLDQHMSSTSLDVAKDGIAAAFDRFVMVRE